MRPVGPCHPTRSLFVAAFLSSRVGSFSPGFCWEEDIGVGKGVRFALRDSSWSLGGEAIYRVNSCRDALIIFWG